MINKQLLKERLDQMSVLSEDWDGFGTGPIAKRVHRVAYQLVEYCPEDLTSLKVFVGVQSSGSLFVEIKQDRRLIEMTILSDATIHWDEIVDGVDHGSGIFVLSRKKLEEILRDQ